MAAKRQHKLSNLVELKRFMSIPIDGYVEQDKDGNYLINIGYIRVSTDKQADEGYGLTVQTNHILDYCKRNDLASLLLFSDDGVTGTKMDRPALNEIVRMIEQFNNGASNLRVNLMIIPRIDRLGRTLLGTLQFIQDYILSAGGTNHSLTNRNREDIGFVSVQESTIRVDKNDPQSKLMLTLFASLAEYDRDMIVRKMSEGRNARIASGKWMGGGNNPFGYRYDKDKDTLIVIPEEADKVREVFRLFVEEKLSPQKIADQLGFKGDKVVREILKRKTYAGYIIWNDKEYRGVHESIITLDRWEEAQEEFESRSVHRGDSHYLLSGLVFCGECGGKMRYQKWNKDGACKLVCYSTHKSNHKAKSYLVKDENCPSKGFWATDIEDAVVAQLFQMSFLADEAATKANSFVDPVAAYEQELKKISRNLGIWYDKLTELEDRDLDTDILSDKIDAALSRKKEIELFLKDADAQRRLDKKIDKAKSLLRNLKDTWAYFSQEEKQAVLRELIKTIKIYTEGEDTIVDVDLKLNSYLVSKKQ